MPSILPSDDTTLRLIRPFNRVLPLCRSLKDLVRSAAKILIISVTNLSFTTADLRAQEKDWGSSRAESISIFDAFLNTQLPELTGVSRNKLGQGKYTRTIVTSLPGN